MKTLEQIKDICSRENNIGMSEEEYKIFDKYTDMLHEAWEESEESKESEEPTESFVSEYFNNFCFEDEFEYLEQ
jgi:arginyl-tRNA--protein-N-Asp/Glu arginylyltransferase